MLCVKCSSQVPENSRFCLSCGSAITASSEVATQAVSAAADDAPSILSSATTAEEGRFVSGSILAERYRIIALLGKGGMGEVYRAIDLKLNQSVALKFLPEALSKDEKALARFYNEVKIARQVANPHVCRVYDLGEVAGLVYISMEFISGEDLSSLLRRIGHIPSGKATDMARQLCAGLAAAHEKGVLHRDLKPANIMLDERGSLRIMDFGLAGLADQIADIRSGTPAYMAPEQLAGKEVTAKSDLYSLGLVLYEIFTGKRPFEAASVEELKRRQLDSAPDSMTSQVLDLDPAVERVILRCLAPDPKDRPASVRAIAGALPGADPLSAAIAAGEMPSPELVAAAGEGSSLFSTTMLIGLLAATFIGIALVAVLGPQVTYFGKSKVEMSPEYLTERASRIIRRAGYTQKPTDTAHGMYLDQDYILYRQKTAGPVERWQDLDKLRPGPLFFWYRESPHYLVARTATGQGVVGWGDPAATASGMVGVQMDLKGRLTAFEAVPPQLDETPPSQTPVEWGPFFRFAGLDLQNFKPVDPKWTPLAAVDARSAWEGTAPEQPDTKIRVEAAAWKGKPVYFDVIGPWTRPFRMQGREVQPGEKIMQIVGLTIFFLLIAAVVFFARFNLKLGRGDRAGAFRLGLFVVLASLTIQVIGGHHVPSRDEILLIQISSYLAIFLGAVVWLLYLALEPPVRKRWPQTLITWSRVLSGRFRDPLVASHVLVGLAAGALLSAMAYGATLVTLQQGDAPIPIDMQTVLGLRFAAGSLIANTINAAAVSLINFFVLFLFKLIFRKNWIAALVFLAFFSLGSVMDPNRTLLGMVTALAGLCSVIFILFRYGLLALATLSVMTEMTRRFYLTFDFGAWYGGSALLAMIAVVVVSLLAFRYALAGRKLISEKMLDV
jgi:hypothetical protein